MLLSSLCGIHTWHIAGFLSITSKLSKLVRVILYDTNPLSRFMNVLDKVFTRIFAVVSGHPVHV